MNNTPKGTRAHRLGIIKQVVNDIYSESGVRDVMGGDIYNAVVDAGLDVEQGMETCGDRRVSDSEPDSVHFVPVDDWFTPQWWLSSQ